MAQATLNAEIKNEVRKLHIRLINKKIINSTEKNVCTNAGLPKPRATASKPVATNSLLTLTVTQGKKQEIINIQAASMASHLMNRMRRSYW